MAALSKRIAALKSAIVSLLVVENALGLTTNAGFDPNEPRDKYGRWTTSEYVEETGEYTTLPRDRVLEEQMRRHLPWEINAAPTTDKDFDPEELIATQDKVDDYRIEEMLEFLALSRRKKFKRVFVAKYKGKFFVLDGHHRVIVLKRAGQNIPGRVIDVDALERKSLTGNARWSYRTQAEKLQAFKLWLQDEIDKHVIGQDTVSWLDPYIKAAYKKGLSRSFNDVNKAKIGNRDFVGRKQQFMSMMADDKAAVLTERAKMELESVTDSMAQQAAREMADGFIQGKSHKEIASAIVKRIDVANNSRGRTLLRTEVVRAHAEGQLDALEALGVSQVALSVEWTTAAKPCKLCRPLRHTVYTIKEARGLIPRHPNCLCCFKPVLVLSPEQVRRRSRIEAAIKKSVKAEIPNKSKHRRSVETQRRYSTWKGKRRKIKPRKGVRLS